MIGLKDAAVALWEILTVHMTIDERRGAWMLVSYGGVRIVAILAIGHILWSCGWLAWIQYNDKPVLGAGFMTVVKAEELIEKKAEETVKEAIAPLQAELAALKTEQTAIGLEVKSQGRELRDLHKFLLEREIREKAKAYYAAAPNSDQRRLANDAIRDLQRRYRAINNGVAYEIPKAEDL